MSVERPVGHIDSDFDEIGKIDDALTVIFTMKMDNREIVPELSTFRRAHFRSLSSVLRGYLRAPSRPALPLMSIVKGQVTPDTKRALAGKRVRIKELSQDGVFIQTSGVPRAVSLSYTLRGLCEKTSQVNFATTHLIKKLKNEILNFSVDIGVDWGRVNCLLRASSGIKAESEVSGSDRVSGFEMSFSVESYFFEDIITERLSSTILVTTTPVSEGAPPS